MRRRRRKNAEYISFRGGINPQPVEHHKEGGD
jgi:hypothetical protein